MPIHIGATDIHVWQINCNCINFNVILNKWSGSGSCRIKFQIIKFLLGRFNKLTLILFCMEFTACDIRCTRNRETFKTLRKSHFFSQAFDIS